MGYGYGDDGVGLDEREMRGEVYCFVKLKQDQAKSKQELDKEKRG